MNERSPIRWQHVLNPKYWPIWLVVGFLRIAAILPYAAQRLLGWLLGWLIYAAAGRRRRITQMNITLCYPDAGRKEQARLVHDHFGALGMSFFEIAMCWYGSDRALRRRVRVEGLAQLDAALADGKGALLLSAHFTTLEIGGRLLGLFRNFHLMYRPNRNELLERIISNSRRRHFERVIPRDDVRTMLKSLKENHPVWYAPDQGFTGKNSATVPFFGVPAPTNTATSRIAKSTGAPVLPFMVERLPGLQGYKLTIDPPLEDFPSGDPVADATRVNAIIESDARRVPEQYLWCHNRFKRKYKR